MTDTVEAIRRDMSRILAAGLYEVLSMDAHEAAERAYVRGGPPVEELERRIRAKQIASGAVKNRAPDHD